MTITMNLEIENGLSKDTVCVALSTMEADYADDGKHLTGNFKLSNTYFVFRNIFPLEEVATENIKTDWQVGMRGAFHSPISTLEESSQDIKNFLTTLANATHARFILSFQFEEVYAFRDEKEVRFLKNIVD